MLVWFPLPSGRGLTPLSALSKRQITRLVDRMSDRARKDVETMTERHFSRSLGIVIRLAARYRNLRQESSFKYWGIR